MIKFISANEMVGEGSYYSFTIERDNKGDSSYNIGDVVWVGETEMEVSNMIGEGQLTRLLGYFDRKGARTLKGALRRVGVV